MAASPPPAGQPGTQQSEPAARPAWIAEPSHTTQSPGSTLSAATAAPALPPHRAAAPTAAAASHRWLWLWAVLGLLAGAVAIIVYRPPAAWLAWLIQTATQGHAQIIDPQGSVWQGDGQLLLTGGKGSRDAMLLPERVHWQLTPGWGQAKLSLNLDCCASKPAHITLMPGSSGIRTRLDALQWTLPAELLEGLGAPLNTLALRGKITVTAQEVQWQQSQSAGSMQGNVTMELLDMSASMSTLDSLGSYRVEVRGQNNGMPKMELKTMQGPLQLEGSGKWHDGRFRFTGQAWPDAGYESSLNNLLNIMGNKSGDRYLLAL